MKITLAVIKGLAIAAVAIAVAHMSSCAPPPSPLVVAPSAPPKAVAVSPVAEAIRADAAAGAIVATRLESQVAGLQKSASTLKDGMQKALDEAARLRAAKAATEAELDSLWQLLTDSNTKARDLFAEAEAARLSADEQRDLRAKAERNLAELTRATALKDAEVESLRLQNADLVKSLDSSVRAHETTKRALSKAEGDAALGSYIKAMGWVIVIAAILIAAAKLFMPPFPLKS